jgi:hypothetical protein
MKPIDQITSKHKGRVRPLPRLRRPQPDTQLDVLRRNLQAWNDAADAFIVKRDVIADEARRQGAVEAFAKGGVA